MKKSSNEITSKNDIINYFQDGCKKVNQLNIGVEHEKFLFEKNLIKELILKQFQKFLITLKSLIGSLLKKQIIQ